MSRLFALAAAVTLALGPIACAAESDGAPLEEASGGDQEMKAAKVITEADEGKTIDVALGQSFSIQLASTPSSGYRWTVQRVDRTLGYPTESYQSSGGAVGSGGKQRFTWSTKSPLRLEGQHAIQLSYQRGSQAPSKTFSVTVNVTSKPSPSPLDPNFCKDGTIEREASYSAASDGKECSMPRVHCVTKNAMACPMFSPPHPDFCKDGTIQREANYIPSSDGKECAIPRLHCLTKDMMACPMFSSPHPDYCKDGTIARETHYMESADGKECAMPSLHCVTSDPNACPML